VGEKKIGRKLRDQLKLYARQGTIQFGEVHLYHGWKRKETGKKTRRKRRRK